MNQKHREMCYFAAGVAMTTDPDSEMVKLLMKHYNITDDDMDELMDEIMKPLEDLGFVAKNPDRIKH